MGKVILSSKRQSKRGGKKAARRTETAQGGAIEAPDERVQGPSTGRRSYDPPASSPAPAPAPRSASHSTTPRRGVRRYLSPDAGRNWNPDDPLTTEGRLGKFNPEDWHPPAKNTHDHFDHVKGIIWPPEVTQEVASIINSKNWPVKSVDQFIRIAVVELLQVFRRLDPRPNHHMAHIELLSHTARHIDLVLGYEDAFGLMRSQVSRLVGRNLMNEARKMAHKMIGIAKKIEVSELRAKYVGELRREFGSLLKGRPISLGKQRKARKVEDE